MTLVNSGLLLSTGRGLTLLILTLLILGSPTLLSYICSAQKWRPSTRLVPILSWITCKRTVFHAPRPTCDKCVWRQQANFSNWFSYLNSVCICLVFVSLYFSFPTSSPLSSYYCYVIHKFKLYNLLLLSKPGNKVYNSSWIG